MPSEPDSHITVLLDTNVFVAAYWSPSSASARLIRACIEGRATAHYSAEVRREVERVLRTIKARQPYIDLLQPFWDQAVRVEGIACESARTEDPGDQKFLEAALGGGTDLLVTNDDHLLSIGYIGRTEILHPKSAAKMLGL